MYFDNNLYFQLSIIFDWKPCVEKGQRKRKKGEFPSAVFRVNSCQKKYAFIPISKKPKALSPQRLIETMQRCTISLGICELVKVKSFQRVTCWVPIITLAVYIAFLNWLYPKLCKKAKHLSH